MHHAMLTGTLMLFLSAAAACATPGTPKTPAAPPPPPNDGHFVVLERANPGGDFKSSLPDGCTFEFEVAFYTLRCPSQTVLVTRTSMPMESSGDTSRTAAIKDFERSGFTLTSKGAQKLTLTQGEQELERFDLTGQPDGPDGLLLGFYNDTQDKSKRAVSCVFIEGQNTQAVCQKGLSFLLEYASRHKIERLRIDGQEAAMPEGCKLYDKLMACPGTSIQWFESGQPQQDEYATQFIELTLAVIEEQGAQIQDMAMSCTFKGKPMKCRAVTYTMEGQPDMPPKRFVVVWNDIDGRYVQFTCETYKDGPGLPEECQLFFEAAPTDP